MLHSSVQQKATQIKATNNGNLATCPGLIVEAFQKFFLDSDEMQKGHTKGQEQNVRSMKVRAINDMDEEGKYVPKHGKKHSNVNHLQHTKWGVFISHLVGEKYQMVAVELNSITLCRAHAIKITKDLIKTYIVIWNIQRATGVISPNWHIMNNEA